MDRRGRRNRRVKRIMAWAWAWVLVVMPAANVDAKGLCGGSSSLEETVVIRLSAPATPYPNVSAGWRTLTRDEAEVRAQRAVNKRHRGQHRGGSMLGLLGSGQRLECLAVMAVGGRSSAQIEKAAMERGEAQGCGVVVVFGARVVQRAVDQKVSASAGGGRGGGGERVSIAGGTEDVEIASVALCRVVAESRGER